MVDHSTPPRNPSQGPSGFDRELNLKAILGFIVGLSAVIALTFAFVWVLQGGLERMLGRRNPPPSPVAEANETLLPPNPRLQTNVRVDLAAMRTHEDSLLYSYGWVDRSRGIVRVPVERAMDEIVQHGVPSWPPAPAEAETSQAKE